MLNVQHYCHDLQLQPMALQRRICDDGWITAGTACLVVARTKTRAIGPREEEEIARWQKGSHFVQWLHQIDCQVAPERHLLGKGATFA